MNKAIANQPTPDLFSREIKNKWTTLLKQERDKMGEIETSLHLVVLKAVKKHVDEQGGRFLLVDNPDYPKENFSENEALINALNWRERINILQQNPPHLGS